jgi:hypothetical protein
VEVKPVKRDSAKLVKEFQWETCLMTKELEDDSELKAEDASDGMPELCSPSSSMPELCSPSSSDGMPELCSPSSSEFENDSELKAEDASDGMPELCSPSSSSCHTLSDTSDSSDDESAFPAGGKPTGKQSKWIVDSGATRHFCRDRRIMTNLRQCEVVGITVADGNRLTMDQCGDARVTLQNGTNVLVKDAMLAEAFTDNLLSVACLDNKGCTVQFGGGFCVIKDEMGSTLATGSLQAKQYLLDVAVVDDAAFPADARPEDSLLHTWHRRLGHINVGSLKKLRSGLATGMNFKHTGKEASFFCEPCVKGKSTRKPFPNRARPVTDQGTWHMDIVGPLPPSMGGSKYIHHYKHTHSGMVVVCMLKAKGDCCDAHERVVKWLRDRGKQMKVIRSDNAKEYLSKTFAAVNARHGIQHQRTAIYSPEQNGMAERSGRTIIEMARTLLHESGLATEFWAEAVNTAAYTLNRSPSGTRNMTPMEAFFQVKPDLSHMRVFGCDAHVHIPEPKREKSEAGKFASKSMKGLLLGYAEDSKCYRIWDPITRRVCESRDVTFNERRRAGTMVAQQEACHRPNFGHQASFDEIWAGVGRSSLVGTPPAKRVLNPNPSSVHHSDVAESGGSADHAPAGAGSIPAVSSILSSSVPEEVVDSTPTTVRCTFQPSSSAPGAEGSASAVPTSIFRESSSQHVRAQGVEHSNPNDGSLSSAKVVQSLKRRLPRAEVVGSDLATSIFLPGSDENRSSVDSSPFSGEVVQSSKRRLPRTEVAGSNPANSTFFLPSDEKTSSVRRSVRNRAPSARFIQNVAYSDQHRELDLDLSESEIEYSPNKSDVQAVQAAWVETCFDQALLSCDTEPRSFRRAMATEEAARWLEACEEEYLSLLKNKTWNLVQLPAGKRALYSKWVFKVKRLSDMSVERFKARLTAGGDRQTKGLDYDEVFAPVVRKESIRLLLALSASLSMKIHQMDVKTAFLNGKLNMEVYMRQPEGFIVNGQEDLVCKLNKALYGLKQAGRIWYQNLDAHLASMGFTRCVSDPCMYYRMSESGVRTIIAVYVDDLMIACTEEAELAQVKRHLSDKYEMTDLGELAWCLGMRVVQDPRSGTITLDQEEYLREVLKTYKMDECNPSDTPAQDGMVLSKAQSPTTAEGKADMKKFPYRSVVGSLLYAAMCTRPDITAAVSAVSRFLENPGHAHWIAVKKILRYIKGTVGLRLVYKGAAGGPELVGYCDSDWAGDVDGRRSTSGYVFFVAGGPVAWGSSLQPIVALSSTEAEYVAACSATRVACWLRSCLLELGCEQTKATVIFEDNNGCISLSKNSVHHSRTKHIQIRFHYTRDRFLAGEIVLTPIASADNTADVMTKALGRIKFVIHRNALVVRVK